MTEARTVRQVSSSALMEPNVLWSAQVVDEFSVAILADAILV